MDTPQDLYDVAIVGLGPTGLTLAHLLGRRGLRVLALEREPQFYGNARAVYTDDECMRSLSGRGRRGRRRSRHAARHAGAMGARRRIGAEPSSGAPTVPTAGRSATSSISRISKPRWSDCSPATPT